MKENLQQKPRARNAEVFFNSGESKATDYVVIPKRFGDPGTSGLTYTVTSGTQAHDIDLE
jgi:hypothetical protein